MTSTTEELRLRPPPELRDDEGGAGLLLNAVPMLGSLGSILLISTMSGGDRTRGWLAGGLFLLATLGFVGIQVERQRRRRSQQVGGSRGDYLDHLAAVRAQVREVADRQRREAHRQHPPPAALAALAEEGSRVWERGPGHPDFLRVRWGTAPAPLPLVLTVPEEADSRRTDPAAAAAAYRLVRTHRSQPGLPADLDLVATRRVEVAGPAAEARGVARALLAGAAAFHHPSHLAVAVLTDAPGLASWDWVKWLPHAHSTGASDAAGPLRLVATSWAELQPLLPTGRHLLLVLDDATDDGPGLSLDGATVVALAGATGGAGVTLPANAVDRLDAASAEACARRLAAAGQDSGGHDGAGRTAAGFWGLLGEGGVRDLDPARAWRPRSGRELLAVPVGVDEAGEPVVLDIKESAQGGTGPHGLVVGATGSGKSEFLRTLVLGMAATHSPEQLNLVLVDFKGGATFTPMAALPHVSAVITNLEDELALVDRMHDALSGELVRRQELLRAAGQHASVRDYDRARAAGEPLDPLPSLFVVVDEFSELLSAKPELLDLFVAIGRVGRSLGLHLLLASQRLDEGRLRGLESHLSYRVALRTFSSAESRAVIGVPDAHELPPLPGAGYLRPDPTTLVRFTAGHVSAPVPAAVAPPSGAEVAPEVLPWTLARVGPVRERTAEPAEGAARAGTGPSLMDVAVRRMQGQGTPAHQVWLPPLDEPDPLDALLPDLVLDPDLGLVSTAWRGRPGLVVPIGTLDRPHEQRRDPLALDLAGAAGHVGVVGGPRSGKSNLLCTFVCSTALVRTAAECQFFLLDLAGGGLSGVTGLPHVSGHAGRAEPDVVRRAVAEVEGILDRRDEGHDDGWGEVFLVVDGWATLRADFEDLEPRLHLLAARGLTHGVHLVVSAARWSELRPALRDVLGSRLELRLGDPLDSQVGRAPAEQVPAGRPGRGLVPEGLHFLAATPTGDLVDRIAAASPHRAPALRLLPARVELAAVQAAAREAAPVVEVDDGTSAAPLLLGVDETELAPVRLDPDRHPHLLVLGDGGSGKSSLLRTYLREVVRSRSASEAQVVLLDQRRALLGEVPDSHLLHYLTTAGQASEAMTGLASHLGARLPGPDVTPAQLRARSWWSGAEVFVVVDDHDLVATGPSSPLAPLQPLLPQAGDVGLHLVVARRVSGASRAMFEPTVQALRDLAAPAFVLSGPSEEGPLVGGVRAVPAPPGRARLVTRDAGTSVVQLAWTDPAD